ncbi:MAG: hypothetical protein ACE5D7_00860 [Fidelibacterota bacterium]
MNWKVLSLLFLLGCVPRWSWSEVQIVKICKDWDNVYIYVTENTDSVKVDFVTLEVLGEYTFFTTKAMPVSPMDHFPVIEIVVYYGGINRKNVKMDVYAWNKYSMATRRFFL